MKKEQERMVQAVLQCVTVLHTFASFISTSKKENQRKNPKKLQKIGGHRMMMRKISLSRIGNVGKI